MTTTDRAAVGHLLKHNDTIDLVIPRGGEALIQRVAAEAAMPVLKHYRGNCHVYVDAAADLEMAERSRSDSQRCLFASAICESQRRGRIG